MKKVAILFCIVMIANLVIPMFWCFDKSSKEETTTKKDIVTIFEEESTTTKL